MSQCPLASMKALSQIFVKTTINETVARIQILIRESLVCTFSYGHGKHFYSGQMLSSLCFPLRLKEGCWLSGPCGTPAHRGVEVYPATLQCQ